MSDFFALALASLSLTALVFARRDIAAAWRRGTRLQAAAAQVLVAGGTLSATNFAPNKLLIQLATIAVFAGFIAAASVGAERVGSCVVRGHGIASSVANPPVRTLLLFWVWLFTVNLVLVPDELFGDAVTRIGSGLALGFFMLAQWRSPIVPLQFYSASLITVCVIAAFTPLAPQWFSRCGRFKCSEVNAILQGPFVSGNLLGISVAMCIALLLMATVASASSFVVLACLLPLLYATMSRTSFMAVGAAVALFSIDHFIIRGKIRNSAFSFAAIATALAAGVLPLLWGMFLIFSSRWDAFSERGAIWSKGRDAVWGFIVTGRGIDLWSVLSNTNYFGSGFNKFTHSEYLLIYFAGGLVGLVLFGLVMFRITYAGIRIEKSLGRGAVVPLTFGVCGMVEAIWNPLTIDAGTWLFFAVIAVAYPRPPADGRTYAAPIRGRMGWSRETETELRPT